MDGLHLPEIGQFREDSGRCLGRMNKNITQHEGLALTGRRQTNSGEKRRSINASKSTKKKRTNNDNRERKTTSNKASNTGKSVQPKTQNTRNSNIGLPKITTNNEEDTVKFNENSGAKKARRTKPGKGDTISYVYSKSLRDENTMAFLRNSVDFEKDFNTSCRDKRSSSDHKKPYGLPALKLSEGADVEREQFLNRELDFSDCSETESLLNAWEAIDDEDSSNGTTSTYHSADCSTGNDD